MALMHSMLSTISPALARSASLAENVTLMGVFTSIASLTLDESVDSDDMYSRMWDASIQTSNHLEGLLELRTTTRSKMEMLLLGGSNGLTTEQMAEDQMYQMIIRWQRLSVSRTNARFGKLCENWLQAYSYGTIRPLSHMRSADSLRDFNNTAIHSNWCAELRDFLNWIAGERTTCATLMEPTDGGQC